REVARSLERGRHAIQTHLPRLLHLRRFERVKEEDLLIARIPEAWNLHRPADVEPGGVDLVFRLGQARARVLPRERRPRIAAPVPVAAAPIILRAALADDLDVCAGSVSLF